MSEVFVIGGGAAGMMAAISAASLGHRVSIFEKNDKLGRKLFITGKGRCNITNACDEMDILANVVHNEKFLYSAIYTLSPSSLVDMLEGMGLSLVEASVGRHRGDVKVNLVLYRQGGISLDDLTQAQKVLRPRLELEFDRESLSVEISSPGMSRKIKDQREYEIFAGRGIRLLIGDDWINGILAGSDGNEVLITQDGKEKRIPLAEIRKAKLD